MIEPHERMPAILRNLLLANLGIFVIQMVSDMANLRLGTELFRWGALVPELVWGHGQVWRVVTYQFLHGGILHIAFNMLSLWMFGTPLVHHMGEKRFLALYLTSGIVAGLGSALLYLLGGAGGIPIIGASGAIFGILLAFARFFPHVQIIVFFLFPMPARYAVWVFGGLAFLAGLQGQGSVAHLTHLFGILGGWLFLRFEDPVALWFDRAVTQKERVQTARIAEELESEENYFDTRVDPILKKISKHGIDSLTKQEKDVLQKASGMKKSDNTIDFRAWRRGRG
ncbi:MAG: rhomboid family intramembrane serine protease [Fibrobacteria bacterium]|nr:rhomboid family intramembrane serine protease [Fibrobacteria bacterium]